MVLEAIVKKKPLKTHNIYIMDSIDGFGKRRKL